jgi:hypothetical protein
MLLLVLPQPCYQHTSREDVSNSDFCSAGATSFHHSWCSWLSCAVVSRVNKTTNPCRGGWCCDAFAVAGALNYRTSPRHSTLNVSSSWENNDEKVPAGEKRKIECVLVTTKLTDPHVWYKTKKQKWHRTSQLRRHRVQLKLSPLLSSYKRVKWCNSSYELNVLSVTLSLCTAHAYSTQEQGFVYQFQLPETDTEEWLQKEKKTIMSQIWYAWELSWLVLFSSFVNFLLQSELLHPRSHNHKRTC